MRYLKSEHTYFLAILLAGVLSVSAAYALTIGAIVLLILLSFFQKNYTRYGASFREGVVLFPMLLYCLTLINFFVAHNHRVATSYLSEYLSYILVPVALHVSAPLRPDQDRYIKKGIVLSVFVTLMLCFLISLIDYWRTGVDEIIRDKYYHYSKFRSYGLTELLPNCHPTYLALFALWAMVFMIDNWLEKGKSYLGNRYVDSAVLVFFCFSIYMLNSVAVIFALLLWVCYRSMLYLKQRRAWSTFRLLVTLVCFLIAMTGFVYINPLNIAKFNDLRERKLLQPTDDEAKRTFVTIRLAKWQTHFDLIQQRPLLGYGADIKDARKAAYHQREYYGLEAVNYNAHNQFIEVWARYGLVGLILFIAMLLVPLFRKPWPALYSEMLLILLVVFLTESVLERQQGLIACMFMYSFLNKKRVTG